MKFSVVLYILVFTISLANAQGKINHLEEIQVIEFVSSAGSITKRIDLLENSVYARLQYPFSKEKGSIRYDISGIDRTVILDSFFIGSYKDECSHLQVVSISAHSRAEIISNYAMVFDNLYLNAKGGPLAVRATVRIYNEKGDIVSTLPESNEGYREASITANGKYFAALYGDMLGEIECTQIPSQGFRLYDLENKLCLVDIRSTNNTDVYPTSVTGNILIEVNRHRSGKYEYYFFDTDARILYRRYFTTDEIGKFIRFSKEGILLKHDKTEKFLSFEKDFTCSNF